MANQVAARLNGDDYQHLYAWQYFLELMMPERKVSGVTIEDALAGSVDDVTVRHEPGSGRPDEFHQVKYHVDQRGEYSTEGLIEHELNHASLLDKFWRTWKSLKHQDPDRDVLLHLVSNWGWKTGDALRPFIEGRDESIKEDFFSASPKTKAGKARDAWLSALGAEPAEFEQFARSLRFWLGFNCAELLARHVAERMGNLGLKNDVAALKVSTGIVREWIMRGRQEITLTDLQATLHEHDLYLQDGEERGVVVYLDTIRSQTYDLAPDYHIDWRALFEGPEHLKGHQLINPIDWNTRMLPELRALEARIAQETTCRLIRARGLARLSSWFAFGNTFSEVANYTIEVVQQGAHWRTDAPPASDFTLMATTEDGVMGETLHNRAGSDRKSDAVAVGISITGSLDDDVREYLETDAADVSAVLLLRPEHGVGPGAIRSAGDLTALVGQAKDMMRQFMKKRRARRLLLFYMGPFSGACFLGHRLNAMGEIQIMEDQQPGYSPSFTLF